MLLSAAVIMCLTAGCGPKKSAENTETVTEASVVETCFTAIDKYLTEEIGQNYAPGEYTIPSYSYAVVDESDPDDIQVWGDFWVFNYNLSGETLETVSGGSHAGKMHLKKDADGHYTVTGFDQVADGSDNMPSAQRIFGEYFDEFSKAQSDSDAREQARAKAIANFVCDNDLKVKYYKDFGWPAVELPEAE